MSQHLPQTLEYVTGRDSHSVFPARAELLFVVFDIGDIDIFLLALQHFVYMLVVTVDEVYVFEKGLYLLLRAVYLVTDQQTAAKVHTCLH